MRRREVIIGGGAGVLLSYLAVAQQRIKRVAVLFNFIEGDPIERGYTAAFERGLADHGWYLAQNVVLDRRYTGGNANWTTAVEQLIAAKPDVIFSTTGLIVKEFRRRAPTIPTVFILVADPVALGLVASIARPGGNVTGFTNIVPSIGGKWFDLLMTVAPSLRRIGYLYNPRTVPQAPTNFSGDVADHLKSHGVELVRLPVEEATGIEAAIANLTAGTVAGLIVMPDPFTSANRGAIIDLVTHYRVPAIYGYDFSADGGLISYGPDLNQEFVAAASYIDRILHGESPANLPVQSPTTFHMAINAKTAKALGLTIPDALIATADQVIE